MLLCHTGVDWSWSEADAAKSTAGRKWPLPHELHVLLRGFNPPLFSMSYAAQI